MEKRVIALAGGVGGSKLTQGLASALKPEQLTVVVNTGDDFNYLGLAICPDLDTVMYTLAGINNRQTGWGVEGDTHHLMEALKKFRLDHWFQLGDQDLATQIERTHRLAAGEALSKIMHDLSKKLGAKHPIIPMSDAPAGTSIHITDGIIDFQTYFVKEKCQPKVLKIEYGSANVNPSSGFLSALDHSELSAIIVCPSNPLLSIAPILHLPGILKLLKKRNIPIIAVSPLIGGKAVKGPAAKIMSELGLHATACGIAHYYGGLIDGLVIDTVDSHEKSSIEAQGIQCCVVNTLMHDISDRTKLAKTVLEFAWEL